MANRDISKLIKGLCAVKHRKLLKSMEKLSDILIENDDAQTKAIINNGTIQRIIHILNRKSKNNLIKIVICECCEFRLF